MATWMLPEPDDQPVKPAELLCSSRQDTECYFPLVAGGTWNRPRVERKAAQRDGYGRAISCTAMRGVQARVGLSTVMREVTVSAKC